MNYIANDWLEALAIPRTNGKEVTPYDDYYKLAKRTHAFMTPEEIRFRSDGISISYGINALMPKKIIRNKRTTIVLWEDGTKTIVRCEMHKPYDAYSAFTAALAKKIYGNNTRLKKMIAEKFVSQIP